jgi:hypothetical protein
MDTPGPPTPGEGELTPRLVIEHAAGMLRAGFLRVSLVALVVFLPPAILSELVEEVPDDLDASSDPVAFALVAAAIFMIVVLKLLGPVAYAGYLDESVGAEYFHGRRRPFMDDLRSLPLMRLLIADVALGVAVTLGLGLLVVPGIVIATLFGLVGPVIVQERRGLVDAFRRTARMSRPAWRLILLLVVLPLGLEDLVSEVVLERAHELHPLVEAFAEWALAVTVGAAVGLVEVAIATELMARIPAVDSGEPRSSLL